MLYTLFFIVPFISITLMISMPLALKHNSIGISISIGKLHTADICKLNENQIKDLCEKSFFCFLFAAICTVIIGFLFIINGYGGFSAATGTAVIICCAIQFLAGWLFVYPILKKAKLLKLELDKKVR